MKRVAIFLLMLATVAQLTAQEFHVRDNRRGIFSLGLRTTPSLFNDGKWDNFGIGSGGHFRLQLSNHVNTEWFADYIKGRIGDFADREDVHIGWSVMLYPFAPVEKLKFLQPYVMMGHCFDYTKIKETRKPDNFAERWSSAIQTGAGVHLNFTQRFDVSLSAQYMIHLGTDLHADLHDGIVVIEKEDGVNLEGHLLTCVSLNYKIADLWK
jgi:hypothetical protein